MGIRRQNFLKAASPTWLAFFRQSKEIFVHPFFFLAKSIIASPFFDALSAIAIITST
ncbi:hypothetical protein QUB47_28405 [Microcoleus sp. AT9_B5]